MGKAPKVSIVSISYNQEKYIREALESFVAQKTDFDFEVIIADDCSTDKTAEIIREFSEAHPGIFRPILRDKNVGIQPNLIGALRAAKGEYIALCEGDDYWTDPQKLQSQVDFLENSPSYALCFHSVRVFFENSRKEEFIFPEVDDKTKFTLKELLNRNFIQTNSVMYRRQKYEKMPENILPLDWYLHLYHAQFGKIGFIDKVMSAYRRHPGGVWWDSQKNIDQLWIKHGLKHLKLFAELLKLYRKNDEYRDVINMSMYRMFTNLIHTDEKHQTGLVDRAMKQFPKETEGFTFYIYDRLRKREIELEEQYQKQAKDSSAFQIKLYETEQIIAQKDQEIALIKASRLWKLRNVLAKILGKHAV